MRDKEEIFCVEVVGHKKFPGSTTSRYQKSYVRFVHRGFEDMRVSVGEAWAYILVALGSMVFGTATWAWTMVNFVWESDLIYYLAAIVTAVWVFLLVLGIWGLRWALNELRRLKTSTVG